MKKIVLLLALLFALPARAVVNAAYSPPSYACDGSTAVFTINFPYLAYTDLVVTSTTAASVVTTLVYSTDYTVSLTSTSSTATLTLTAPATSCPTGNTLKIARNTARTQPTGFRAQTDYVQSLHETAFDRQAMISQEIDAKPFSGVSAVTAAPVTLPLSTGSLGNTTGTANSFSRSDHIHATSTQQTGTGSVVRPAGDKLNDFVNGPDFGVNPTGSDISSNLQAVLNAKTGIVYLPANATCYNIGTTTISVANGRYITGGGLGQSNGPTCITYSGSSCAITINDAQFAGLRDLDIQVNSASATAAGVCMQGTSVTTEFNELSGVSIRQTNATRRVAGQVGLLLKDNGQGVYWNTFKRLRFAYWDNSIKLVGGANGANANNFEDLMSYGHVTAFHTVTTQVTNNRVFGMHCSRSDGTWAGTSNCVVLGDDNTNSQFNSFFFVTSDQGVPSTCFSFGTNAGGNVVFSDCQSGGAAYTLDTNATAFPNFIYDTINGASPSYLHLGRLAVKNEISLGATPATSGDLRFSNNQSVRFRNAANSADLTVLTSDTNDRLQLGTSNAFVRLNNNINEHGTGTVANSGNDRFTSNWTMLARNAANNANVKIGDFGNTTADVFTLGDTVAVPTVTFAGLGTPANFAIRGCSDCTIANPCAGGGTGALAKRLNGVWVCN